MRILIVGAGEVGTYLARYLVQESHEVTILDQDGARVQRLSETLDLKAMTGSGTHVGNLRTAEAGEADLVLALTSVDEVNMLTSLFAKRLGARAVIARLSSEDVRTGHPGFYRLHLGLDLVVNPAMLAAAQAVSALTSGGVTGIAEFGFGKVYLRPFTVMAGSPFTRKQLRELSLPGALIAAVVRADKVSIPSGDDKLEAGDKIMVICRREAIQHVQKGVGETEAHAKRVIIVGGGNIGLAIAQYFDYPRYRCTVFEPDRARAWQLAETLRHVKVIEGDGADRSLLREESVDQTDAFVSCTGSDEKNLMTAVMAKDLGVPRTVAVVDKPQFAELGNKLGLSATLPPRILAASQILSYIRGGQFNRISLIAEGQAEVVEFTVQQGSPLLRAPLMKLGLPKGLIVGALIRGNKAVIPKGADSMQPGDSVIMFALHEHLPYIESLLKAERQAAETEVEAARAAAEHSSIMGTVGEVSKL